MAAEVEREEEEGRRRADLGEVLLKAMRVVTYIGESVSIMNIRDPGKTLNSISGTREKNDIICKTPRHPPPPPNDKKPYRQPPAFFHYFQINSSNPKKVPGNKKQSKLKHETKCKTVV